MSKWQAEKAERNHRSLARLNRALPRTFPSAVLSWALGRPFVPPTPRLAVDSYWRAHPQTESVNETSTKEAGASQCKLQVTYISVVVTPMMVLIPRATRIVAMTPGPVVFVIVVAMT